MSLTRTHRTGRRTLGVVLVMAACAGMSAGQQADAGTQASPAARDAAKPVLSQKQKDLEADTERLVMLAAALKVSMDKATKDQLSLDVVRKAEAIEKLAKSVKDRMRAAQ